MQENPQKTLKIIRLWLSFFIIALVLSGITAFPIETQLAFAHSNLNWFPEFAQKWISEVYFAIKTTNEQFPYLAYGTDWLAFAHLVIAVAFIGPLRDPVRNIWVIEFGMIACMMVIPLALIAGPIREIPFYWRLVDCSFGVFGIMPLYYCRKKALLLEQMRS